MFASILTQMLLLWYTMSHTKIATTKYSQSNEKIPELHSSKSYEVGKR